MSEQQERFSSAPAYPSVYTPDDYDENGRLKRIRQVPLGHYPEAIEQDLGGNRDFLTSLAPSSHPVAPPPPPPPGLSKNAKRKQKRREEEEEEQDEYGPEETPGFSIKEISRPLVKFDPSDPPEILSDDHAIAVVSYLANRHPQEEELLEKYFQQYVAKRLGTYNPTEDPPVRLQDIAMRLVVKVSRTFSKRELEEEPQKIQAYMKKLHGLRDMNIVPLQCGKPQVFPVTDRCRGEYKDAALQQQMDYFYQNQEKAREDLDSRMRADARAAVHTQKQAIEMTKEEWEGSRKMPPPAVQTQEEELARKNAEQEQWRKERGVAIESSSEPPGDARMSSKGRVANTQVKWGDEEEEEREEDEEEEEAGEWKVVRNNKRSSNRGRNGRGGNARPSHPVRRRGGGGKWSRGRP